MTSVYVSQAGFSFEIPHFCTVYSNPSQFVVMWMLAIVLPGILVFTLYGSIIVVIIRRQGKWGTNVAPEPLGGQINILSTLQKEQAARRQRRSIRVAVTCAAVTLLFLACWLPAWTVTLLIVFKLSEISSIVHNTTVLFVYLHCCMSPVVYFIADDRFRSEFLRLVCRTEITFGGTTST